MGTRGARGCVTRRMASSQGAAVVEFALLMPLFLMIVFGAIDFGVAINRHTVMNNSAREGAREGVFNPDADQVSAVVRNTLTGIRPEEVDVVVSCLDGEGTETGCGENAESGGTVVVSLTYTNEFITPAPVFVGIGQTMDLTAEVRMRIE